MWDNDRRIDKNEADKIMNDPAIRSHVLSLPAPQGRDMLRSAMKSNPQVKQDISSMKLGLLVGKKPLVMKVLTARAGTKVPPNYTGKGMSPADAQKFIQVVQTV